MSNLRHTEQPIIAIVGPTASGKSALAIELALRYSGEVINCDSVQVYREVEIATAKVSVTERRGVPHHLIDFVAPGERYTAGDWARDAIRIINEIEARRKLALIVGGSGLYLRALRRPLFESPPTTELVRRRVIELRKKRGPHHLHKLLARLDAGSAARLHARDWSRVQRALEYRLQTGCAFAEAQRAAEMSPPALASRLHVFALNPPRAALYERINLRTADHYRQGLVEEVRGLLARGVSVGSSALGAHSYRRTVEYLRGERPSVESAIEQSQLDVRHYAKRQLTWFRREPGVHWVNGFGEDPAVQKEVAALVAELLSGH